MDENDNSPVFDITSDTSVDIAENTPRGEKVAVVLARDKDAELNGLVRIHEKTKDSRKYECKTWTRHVEKGFRNFCLGVKYE